MTFNIFFQTLCNKFFNHETPELPNSRTSILLLIFLFLIIKTTTAQFQITRIAKFYQRGINISCYGAMDGEINLVVEGETGPYLFNWSNGSFSQSLQNLSAGDYTVVVTNINGQTETATITLYQPNELRVTLEPVVYDGGYHITAAGYNDGVIVAHVEGGTADYLYLWSNGETQYKADGLSAGNYSVTVTDMNACTASATVVLTQPTPLQVVSITSPMNNGYNVSCKDGSDGAINLVVAGGVQSQPYTFRWSTGREEQNLSGIPAGNYSVRITDAAGASVVTQITLTEPPLFKISGMVPSLYPNGKNLSCNTCSNGSITVNTTGGVGTPTYLWETGPTTQTITNQQAGTYFVTVTDLNGCTANSSKSLVAPERDDWSMFGNANILPDSQYIGTKDNKDFVLRTNNIERLRAYASGNLKISKDLSAENINADNKITIGGVKVFGFSPATGGNPEIMSFGSNPTLVPFSSISSCVIPTLNVQTNYQFNGTIQLYGNSYAGGNLNVMEVGFDGANSIIDATGTSTDPAVSKLLLNYYCGRDVIVGNHNSGDLFANHNFFVNGNVGIGPGILNPTERLEVNGNIKATSLAGTGNRIVLADQDGRLIPSLTNSTSTEWSTTGNSQTNSSQDYIGTSDYQDLVFKINSNEVLRMAVNEKATVFNAPNSLQLSTTTIGPITAAANNFYSTGYIGFNARRYNSGTSSY